MGEDRPEIELEIAAADVGNHRLWLLAKPGGKRLRAKRRMTDLDGDRGQRGPGQCTAADLRAACGHAKTKRPSLQRGYDAFGTRAQLVVASAHHLENRYPRVAAQVGVDRGLERRKNELVAP